MQQLSGPFPYTQHPTPYTLEFHTMDPMQDYYAQGREEARLTESPHGAWERIRTQELVERHLPEPPATVLDVGGGPGAYAFWLAGLGYDVHLIDASPLHIEQVHQRQANPGEPELASAALGDARALDVPEESAEAVLLLGPLYHLTERADRLAALREARRVLRPGGWLFAVGISRFASLLDGLSSGFLHDPAFEPIVDADLASGQHRNPTANPGYFTTAFFHHPQELHAEAVEAGFREVRLLAIEGPAWVAADLDAYLEDAAARDTLLSHIRRVESETSLLGMSPHIMAIGRKAP